MMRGHFHRSARNIEIRSLLDSFFVFAIATILLIRLQLWATNYPKLGGGKLHIAHLLWGGLGMLVAIVLLLSFLSRSRRHIAAILGGIGFGFFIDEIGKFVTSNNDYFFKPAAGIIYVVFIVLFLVMRELGWKREFSPQECLANAMSLLSESSFRKLTHQEEQLARNLLSRCDRQDPLVPTLHGMLDRIGELPTRPPGRIARARNRLRNFYLRVAGSRRFAVVLIALFALMALTTMGSVAYDAYTALGGDQKLSVITVVALVSALACAVLVLIGVSALRTSRVEAYRWFERALLVEIFFTDVFVFIEYQFAAAFDLLFALALLFTLRTMIHIEVRHTVTEHELPPAAPAPVPAGESVVTA